MDQDNIIARPEGYSGKGDADLKRLLKQLIVYLDKAESAYRYDTLKFEGDRKIVFAGLILEFAEDLHNDIGLWSSIEYYNNQMFSTPLPLFAEKNEQIAETFDVKRIKYFIHTIFYEFEPDAVIAPDHVDLETLAKSISVFLTDRFAKIPKDSGLKKFLAQPDKYGWDFKRKLVWVGLNTYLFRYNCGRYLIKKNNGKQDISAIDDFLCQENTIWSGLGVTDILGKTLNLPDNLLHDVRSWYERHFAYFEVISAKSNKVLLVRNIINDQTYEVMTDTVNSPFVPGLILIGSLVPYGKYWYWSGIQHNIGKIKIGKELDDLKKKFIHDAPQIVYRYDKELLEKATEGIKIQYSDFTEYFGDDLAVFKDGLSMTAALQKKERARYEKLPEKEMRSLMKKHRLENPFPKINFPDYIIESDNGVAVYFNENEGTEIMLGFDDLLSGLKKQGVNLTEDESESIREFIFSDSICPDFVYKLTNKYGIQSVQKAFLLSAENDNLDFLLHKYKGHFFRNRYPYLSFS